MNSWILAAIVGEAEAWVASAFIALWLVITCLKIIGNDLDHALRCHELKVKAHQLRIQYMSRLRELGIKHGKQ